MPGLLPGTAICVYRGKRKIVLKYLADSVLQITTVLILVGMILAYVNTVYGELTRKRMLISVGIGLAASIAMAIMKTATDKIDTGTWNLWIYLISFAAFLVFIISTIIGKRLGKLHESIPFVALSLIIIVQMVYSLADFFVYPNTIMLTEDSVVSSVFLTKMAGVVVGLIIALVLGFAAYNCYRRLKKGEVTVLLIIAILITQLKQIAAAVSIMLARRIIPSNHTLFVIAKYASNYSNVFIYATMAVLLIAAIILFSRSLHVNEPYNNPAQHRKIIFKWKVVKRWCLTVLIGIALSVFIMTFVYAEANKEIELSPIEDCEIRDQSLYIPFEQVDDGHLHRFGYETEDGTVVRVIMIKKPNSSAYGIGLDACEICGETGYYEKDGVVVCNRCDVVMNINTIGYEGGCNPIVIDYTISNGHIIIPIDGLLDHKSEFE